LGSVGRDVVGRLGAEANTGWLEEAVDLDERSFVLRGKRWTAPCSKETSAKNVRGGSFLIETRMPGEFAAGDVRGGSIKRCASAVSEGVMAVRLVHKYLATGGLQYAAGGG
jgi:thioredoxin reductase (NADPH)